MINSTSAQDRTTALTSEKIFLNIGCGTSGREKMPAILQNSNWKEVRIDISPEVNPDINTSITDLSMIRDHSVDAIWSSHNLEHLDWQDVGIALAECKRVLKTEGFIIITLPDLEQIAEQIVAGNLLKPLYHSPIGPITPLDMLFGHQESIHRGRTHMQHRTGFTVDSLGQVLHQAGFENIRAMRGRRYDLWAIASMAPLEDALLGEIKRTAA